MSGLRVTLLGAAGRVTGSATLIEGAGRRVLVDFGLVQGSAHDELLNFDPPGFDARWVDAVVCTHAHVDHCGRLPMLGRLGFTGQIYATPPTVDLLTPVLRSAARLQRTKIHESRSARRLSDEQLDQIERAPVVIPPHPSEEDIPPDEVLYTEREAEDALARLVAVEYGRAMEIAPGVTVRFHDAAHIIGSASIELRFGNGAAAKTIVCSGDLGPRRAPLLPEKDPLAAADAVLLESTYGARTHPPAVETVDRLKATLVSARESGGVVLIPTFAVGRAQQLLYRLAQLSRAGVLRGMPVYLDTNLALRATEVYGKHADRLEPAAQELVRRGQNPMHFPELFYIDNRRDSMRLARLRSAGVIIAGAGFCHGGPITHHLQTFLPRHEAKLLLVGHQPAGTPAALLAKKPTWALIHGQEIPINAVIEQHAGFSGHADQPDLVAWLGSGERVPGAVILNHGDDSAREALRAAIGAKFDCRVEMPEAERVIDV